MATITLLCNENYALKIRQDIESARKQLVNGELSEWNWSVGKQPIAKVGDRIFIQRTNTYPPAGYFATGFVVSAEPGEQLKLTNKKYANLGDCYCNEFFDGKYVARLRIDSVVDYNLPLKLDDLKQKDEFEEANFFVPEGHTFDAQYAKALEKAWENHLASVQQNGVSAFTVLSRKGNRHFQQKDYEAALQAYEEALKAAESLEALLWINFFGSKIEQCEKKIEKISSPKFKVVEIFPDEVTPTEVLYEGSVRQVTINAYERNHEARKKCIEHYGTSCGVCKFNFGEVFGEIGKGFIHVHHLKPLSEIGEEYEVNPIEDMLPVCPNCHAMLHCQTPPLSIERLKAVLNERKCTEKFIDSTVHCRKKLGDFGEDLAESLLKRNGFDNVEDLNSQKNNFPFADFYAEKDGNRYVISVKTRKKYESTNDGTKKLNSRYKLGEECYKQAKILEYEFNAQAAWLTICLDAETYSAYFGLLSSLNGSTGVIMSEEAKATYQCLAKDEPHDFDYAELRNTQSA